MKVITRHHDQYGMALLEVIVAMLIFALAILPLVRLQVMSMDATKAGYFKTETAAAAQSVMDYLSTSEHAVFDSGWSDVVVKSGDDCESVPQDLAKGLAKTACNILNGQSSGNSGAITNTHPKGNAVLCIFQEPAASRSRSDQRLVSIRAVWYIGKHQDSDGGHLYHNTDLTPADCGANYNAVMNQETINKENIDSIIINMAY